MLDIEKCRYLIKSAQFQELKFILEDNYEELFDKALLEKFTKEELKIMSMSDKIENLIMIKSENKSALLRFANVYYDEEMNTQDKIKRLLDLYKPMYKLFK